MPGSLFNGRFVMGLVLLAFLCVPGGCRRDAQEAQESPADRDARRGGVSSAPLPPPVPPGGAASRPAEGEPATPGPAAALPGEEAVGGVHGHAFAGFEDARKVVFVCDGTGTMVKKFPFLRAELMEAINRLKPGQSFNVVFYFDGPRSAPVISDALLPAGDAGKRKALEFIEEFSPSGQAYPVPALRLGLRFQPDVLFFVSEGEFNNLGTYENIVAAIAEANPGNRTRIHTVMFGGYDAEAEQAMKQIARRHGGTHRFVRDDDLGG